MARILLVDDEFDITNSIKRGLEHNGFQVDAYNEPEQALSEFKSRRYNLALVDVKMPKVSGFELFRGMKKKDNNIKVCFLTALDAPDDEFRKTFPDIPVQCFLRKPIGIKDLVSHVQSELKM